MTVTGIQSGYSTKGVRPRAERHTNHPYETRINSVKRELAALKKRYTALDSYYNIM
ncbi:MAG: hypothetical protein FWG70_05490 [Oscillospiraceae bacterium]|nr:hypothetical protein [Oscillospiraceae bacterium]